RAAASRRGSRGARTNRDHPTGELPPRTPGSPVLDARPLAGSSDGCRRSARGDCAAHVFRCWRARELPGDRRSLRNRPAEARTRDRGSERSQVTRSLVENLEPGTRNYWMAVPVPAIVTARVGGTPFGVKKIVPPAAVEKPLLPVVPTVTGDPVA